MEKLFCETAMQQAAVAACVGLFLAHGMLTRPDVQAGLTHLQEMSRKLVDHQPRYQEELLQERIKMLANANKVLIHVAFVFTLVLGWKAWKDPSLSCWCQFLGILAAYIVHAFSHALVKTEFKFRCFEVVCVCVHVVLTAGVMKETDFTPLFFGEKILEIGIIFTSVTLIDLKVTLAIYLCEAAVFIHKECQLVGFEHLTFTIFASILTSRFVMAGLIIFIDHIMRSNILARMDSSDASSLILGCRQVLRGVCDGDLLLDRSTCRIVDDASGLERLLKSDKKLVNTNFLDLFLDTGSRAGFLHFLNTQPKYSADSGLPRMPSGLRIALQGASGPVSVDVFQANVPNQGATGIDYCLLALKEDPERSCPDALPNSASAVHSEAVPHRSEARTGSSVSEVVAYDELLEFALLVSSENSLFDIKEAHFRFRRSTSGPALVSGMPTLKRFIRSTDWHRIETMFENLTHLSPSQMQQRCTFRRPMLFRLPGESRSYLCSRLTSMYLAHEVTPGMPVHFWMNLSSFDASHIRRPREQELEGIREE